MFEFVGEPVAYSEFDAQLRQCDEPDPQIVSLLREPRLQPLGASRAVAFQHLSTHAADSQLKSGFNLLCLCRAQTVPADNDCARLLPQD